MYKNLKIGVLKETKIPPDKRVPIVPDQVIKIQKRYPELEIYVQSSDIRCFDDREYLEKGINVVDDVSFCDVLVGVKEVEISRLISDKTYFFFSHTAKEQPYNRELLKSILNKNITIIDYEYLTDDSGQRLIAFGRWAGIVGCYNGLRGYGLRNHLFNLPPAYSMKGMKDMHEHLDGVKLSPVKIVITGHGRVSKGACEILDYINAKKVDSQSFLNEEFEYPVYCVLDPKEYVKRTDDSPFDYEEFFKQPENFVSNFLRFTDKTDILVSCHFWDPNSPVLMTINDMAHHDFKISVIADVTCDIEGSIPSTIRPSTIKEPFYGFCPIVKEEVEPFTEDAITVMAVDNLPGELPRDASEDFGNALVEKIIPCLVSDKESSVLRRATIAENGKLTENYTYLTDYVNKT